MINHNRSHDQPWDVLVVGGGVVGSACALALARAGLRVALIEAQVPQTWSLQPADLRVFALAADNAALLADLGVWPQITQARAQAYRRMQVWDAAGGDDLVFDADTFGRNELGWIVENRLLIDRLHAALPTAGVQLYCPAQVVAVEQNENSVRLRLADGQRIETSIVIAADGAHSSVRKLAGLEATLSRYDYQQCGVVAYIDSELPNQATAWQRFLPSGPLAILPFGPHRSSIVWTVPEDEAPRLLALDDARFNSELTHALAARLGDIQVVSARAAFPLRQQLLGNYVAGRVLALGDAAHVVHPLAGQGVNLGLRDVSALSAMVRRALQRGQYWASTQRLQRWARTRCSENTLAAYSFQAINRLFSNDDLLLTLARGHLLGLAGRIPLLRSLAWQQAAGL